MARRRGFLLIGIVAAVSVLAGCTAPADVGATPAPTASTASPAVVASANPTPTSAATPETAAPLAIPDCDALLTDEQIVTLLGDERVVPHELDPGFVPTLPGPVARATLASATSFTSCSWGIPGSDGGFILTVAAIPQQASDDLIAALAASSEYEQSTDGDVERFTKDLPDGLGASLGYAFDGGVWAIADGTLLSQELAARIAQTAVEAVTG